MYSVVSKVEPLFLRFRIWPKRSGKLKGEGEREGKEEGRGFLMLLGLLFRVLRGSDLRKFGGRNFCALLLRQLALQKELKLSSAAVGYHPFGQGPELSTQRLQYK